MCVFCEIIAGRIPCFKLYEDSDALAFMDVNPVSPGHCLVVPKECAANLMGSSPKALVAAIHVVQRMVKVVNAVLQPDGVTVFQANGKGSGQQVFHTHFHVIPRHIGDGLHDGFRVKPELKDSVRAFGEKIRDGVTLLNASPAPARSGISPVDSK
jgi:histidine triad (HIT) family protein